MITAGIQIALNPIVWKHGWPLANANFYEVTFDPEETWDVHFRLNSKWITSGWHEEHFPSACDGYDETLAKVWNIPCEVKHADIKGTFDQ